MSGTLLEAVARARDARRTAWATAEKAEAAFLKTLVQARRSHSWREIADVAGLARNTVRYHVEHLNERRRKP